MDYSETERASLMVAAGVVVFSMIAIITFILTRGSIFFYLVAAVAVALELYMAYRISKEGRTAAQEKAAKKGKPKK